MRILSRHVEHRVSRRERDGVIDLETDHYVIDVLHGSQRLSLEFTHDPSDDEVVAQARAASPVSSTRLEPTAAAGKPALRDLLDEQVQAAQAWDWFATKTAGDGALAAAAKTAVAALATAEYERAKRLLQAWRAAT